MCIRDRGVISTEFWNDVPAPPLSLALTAYLTAMESMEFTRPQLKELLPRVIADSTPLSLSDPEIQKAGSRILFYFLYRYVLRGVWSDRENRTCLLYTSGHML